MPQDPLEEWRRLTRLYSDMGDLEIQELAHQINDLTSNAQRILRDELKKRAVSAERTASPIQGDPREQDAAAYPDHDPPEDGDGSGDYTWKVALCRCESLDEAAARCEMLRQAGIDSWIQRPGAQFVVPWLEAGAGDIQINVAADQLDQAKLILLQPIPQDIIDDLRSQLEAPQYEIPNCPKCHAPDPILESIEPTNNWLCESCGYTWSDPVVDASEQTARLS